MLASPLLMGLVLLVDPWAKRVEFSGGAAFEVRGGSAPLQGGQVAEPALRLSFAPTAVLLYQDRVRGRELRLEYAPQMYFRASEQYFLRSQVRRPLFFHTLRARYGGDFNPRWSWQGAAGASIGEMDYSLQASQLGTSSAGDGTSADGSAQGTLLDSPVVRTGGGTLALGVTGRVAPLHSISVTPSMTVQRLLTEIPTNPDGTSGFVFHQTSGDLTLSHQALASRVDSITTSVSGGYADFLTNGAQAYVSGRVAWRRRLRPRLDSQLSGGLFYTRQVRVPDNLGGADRPTLGIPVLPTFDYLLTGRVHQRARLRITANANAGTRAYFDPVQGSVLPLAGGGLNLSFFMPPDLTAGVTSSYYTPPTQPTEIDANNPAAGRSSLSISTPVTYQIRSNLSLEAGTIFTGRGPHVSLIGADGPFPVRELWVYVSVRMFFST